MFQQNDICSKPYFLVFHLYRRKRQFNDTSVNLGRRSAKTYFTERSILGGVRSLRSSRERSPGSDFRTSGKVNLVFYFPFLMTVYVQK